MSAKMSSAAKSTLYQQLPSVDELLRQPPLARAAEQSGHAATVAAVRVELAALRKQISSDHFSAEQLARSAAELPARVERALQESFAPSLRPVINATGVVLHTNLGRAPLAASALERIRELGAGYCNLEFDLENGRRGHRDTHADRLFREVFAQQLGAKPAQQLATVVVNNNAAAVLLALNTLGEGGEAIVSRGELVEIGGSFRIPDVMAKAGVRLREVGTTNRTRLSDYARAINANTRVLLRVHRSNFAISGFTEQPRREELAQLARKRRLPLLEDLGSGALAPPGLAGLNAAMHEENSVAASVRAGASVVTYSGDKLLGGPQAGVLTGKKELIGRIRQNPLFRALRVDKLTYAALEATLAAYLREDFASIPTLRMMRLSAQKVGERAEAIARLLEPVNGLRVQIRRGTSMVGGGAAPAAKLPTFLLAIAREGMSAEQLAQALRRSSPPIVARIAGERVLLDLRTVLPEQEAAIVARLHELARP